MKNIIALLALCAMSNANAQRDECAEIGKLAYNVAKARMAGVPMSNLMAGAANHSIIQSVVTSAYRLPRYSTTEHKERASQEHRVNWEIACYEATKGQTIPPLVKPQADNPEAL